MQQKSLPVGGSSRLESGQGSINPARASSPPRSQDFAGLHRLITLLRRTSSKHSSARAVNKALRPWPWKAHGSNELELSQFPAQKLAPLHQTSRIWRDCCGKQVDTTIWVTNFHLPWRNLFLSEKEGCRGFASDWRPEKRSQSISNS